VNQPTNQITNIHQIQRLNKLNASQQLNLIQRSRINFPSCISFKVRFLICIGKSIKILKWNKMVLIARVGTYLKVWNKNKLEKRKSKKNHWNICWIKERLVRWNRRLMKPEPRLVIYKRKSSESPKNRFQISYKQWKIGKKSNTLMWVRMHSRIN